MARLKREAHVKPAWHGKAFLMEALVLLAFLVAALAVTLGVAAHARAESLQGERLANAIQLARNAAEAFAADPASMQGEALTQDDLAANVQVESEMQAGGTLYSAHIEVRDARTASGADDEAAPVYTLSTARYVPDAGQGAAAGTDGTAAGASEADAGDGSTTDAPEAAAGAEGGDAA